MDGSPAEESSVIEARIIAPAALIGFTNVQSRAFCLRCRAGFIDTFESGASIICFIIIFLLSSCPPPLLRETCETYDPFDRDFQSTEGHHYYTHLATSFLSPAPHLSLYQAKRNLSSTLVYLTSNRASSVIKATRHEALTATENDRQARCAHLRARITVRVDYTTTIFHLPSRRPTTGTRFSRTIRAH